MWPRRHPGATQITNNWACEAPWGYLGGPGPLKGVPGLILTSSWVSFGGPFWSIFATFLNLKFQCFLEGTFVCIFAKKDAQSGQLRSVCRSAAAVGGVCDRNEAVRKCKDASASSDAWKNVRIASRCGQGARRPSSRTGKSSSILSPRQWSPGPGLGLDRAGMFLPF